MDNINVKLQEVAVLNISNATEDLKLSANKETTGVTIVQKISFKKTRNNNGPK
jgi:hypothetical protein